MFKKKIVNDGGMSFQARLLVLAIALVAFPLLGHVREHLKPATESIVEDLAPSTPLGAFFVATIEYSVSRASDGTSPPTVDQIRAATDSGIEMFCKVSKWEAKAGESVTSQECRDNARWVLAGSNRSAFENAKWWEYSYPSLQVVIWIVQAILLLMIVKGVAWLAFAVGDKVGMPNAKRWSELFDKLTEKVLEFTTAASSGAANAIVIFAIAGTVGVFAYAAESPVRHTAPPKPGNSGTPNVLIDDAAQKAAESVLAAETRVQGLLDQTKKAKEDVEASKKDAEESKLEARRQAGLANQSATNASTSATNSEQSRKSSKDQNEIAASQLQQAKEYSEAIQKNVGKLDRLIEFNTLLHQGSYQVVVVNKSEAPFLSAEGKLQTKMIPESTIDDIPSIRNDLTQLTVAQTQLVMNEVKKRGRAVWNIRSENLADAVTNDCVKGYVAKYDKLPLLKSIFGERDLENDLNLIKHCMKETESKPVAIASE